jgi:hypothetical protein
LASLASEAAGLFRRFCQSFAFQPLIGCFRQFRLQAERVPIFIFAIRPAAGFRSVYQDCDVTALSYRLDTPFSDAFSCVIPVTVIFMKASVFSQADFRRQPGFLFTDGHFLHDCHRHIFFCHVITTG